MKKNQSLSIFLKLSPLLIPFILLFAGGLVFALVQSLGFLLPQTSTEIGFKAYTELLSDPWFLKSFLYSLYVAFFSALLSVVIGLFLAYSIWQMPVKYQIYSALYKIPLILPHIVVAFIVLVFFGKSGFFSSMAFKFGLICDQNSFPSIIFGGNGLGIILAYVYKEIPFVVLMVSAVLKKLNHQYLETARMLGAGPVRRFFKVVLPFLLPALHSVFVILFLYSFGAFDIPFILGESNPEMLSIRVFNLYFKRDLINRPYAMAMLVIMFAFSAFFVFLYSKMVKKLGREGRAL